MIFTAKHQVNNSQAVTVSAASTDYLDLGFSTDLGTGKPVLAVTAVTETFAGSTAFTVSVEGSTDSSFTTPITLGSVEAVDVTPNQGMVFSFPLASFPSSLRYLRFYYTVAGTITAGKVTSFLAQDAQLDAVYPDARSI